MRYLLFLLSLYMIGCASPYSASGIFGGYSETKLDEEIYKISYIGNGFTSVQQSSDYAMLRAAELCWGNGYEYFAVVNTQNLASSVSKNNVQPSSELTVKFYKEKPAETVTVELNAQSVIKNLKQKYDLNEKPNAPKEKVVPPFALGDKVSLELNGGELVRGKVLEQVDAYTYTIETASTQKVNVNVREIAVLQILK
jgi:hypothetical protein